ncbi:hypothetical protein C8F01DRAFT_1036417 [Mycena amicta]|nr:hypothetical protein C8F01DRAFT_1036417 [Mycena amicta]
MDPAAEPFTRAEGLWFEDGTIVVRAHATLFKVYRSLLALQSTVFRDMLAFPQPDTADEMVEGCPVVVLPDQPADVLHFLRAIFNSRYFMPPPARINLSEVLSVLRLAHKYDVDYLFRRALGHLDGCFYFDSYRAYYNQAPDTVNFVDDCAEQWSHMTSSPLAVVAITQVAREVDALWILPVARYCLSIVPLHKLIEIPPTELDGPQLKHVLLWRSRLSRIRVLDLSLITEVPDSACENFAGCAVARLDILRAHGALHQVGNDACILGQPALNRGHLCGNCLQFESVRFDDLLDGRWDQLPELFNLPPWEDLKEQRRKVLGV